METTEIHVHIWNDGENWLAGVIDHRTSPHTAPLEKHAYTALSSLDPNMLIHCYWIGELPDDKTRDYVQPLIVSQAMGFYEVLKSD